VSIANCVFYFLSQVLPADIQNEAQFLVTAAVAGAVAFIGKVLRDRGLGKVII
jgi:hypothetical protein